jgi:hypothetical protein
MLMSALAALIAVPISAIITLAMGDRSINLVYNMAWC